jgi:transcriptional regulator with XRE-family HTH domain
MSNFAKNLRYLLETSPYSRREVADIAKVSYKSITQYEAGICECKFDCLIKLSKTFNISVDTLLTTDIEANTNEKFVKNLQKKMNKLGYTINIVSQATRIPNGLLNSYYTGKEIPSQSNLKKLSLFLKTPVESFFN